MPGEWIAYLLEWDKSMGMIDNQDPWTDDPVSFGPFRMYAAQRLIESGGTRLQLGARALDILIALVEQAGKVVSKNDLMRRVWPDVTVDEGNLRVHVAALRKALGDGEAGARYVTTVSGQGYCFVAPISRSSEARLAVTASSKPERAHNLPTRLTRMVGRDQIVREISGQLADKRFVTIAGPGGIGKTTVAVSVAHELLPDFAGEVLFFDLGSLNDPVLVPSAVASRLGLLVQSTDPTPGLIGFLRDKRMLLILDSCEHVIDTAAALAERIFEDAPQVHILATSRESLRVEGEHVLRLAPLGSPPEAAGLTAAEALGFPAVQLFVERAIASGRRFELNDVDAPVVAEICRRLDGIALAIELAAGRANACSVQETMALLNDRFKLLWEGRRTALPRHQTLSATLDWSYDLLSEPERMVLRRLSVFTGLFTLEAARSVAADDEVDDEQVVTAVVSLVAKSLVTVNIGGTTRYRLLDTTRAYAARKLSETGSVDAIKRRHAFYYRDWLERINATPAAGSGAKGVAAHGESLGNVRAALEWSFFGHGDIGMGLALAAAAAPLFIEMSLLTECHRWTERAVAVLDDASRGTRHEMELQAALGLSLMFTKGNSDQVRGALLRGLELAEQLGDLHSQLRLFGRLHIFHERIGDFHSALRFAERGEAVAAEIADPIGIAEAHSALGISRHLEGDNLDAHAHLEAALVQHPASQRINTFHFGFDYRNRARISFARTLWVEGYPDRAAMVARQTVEEAETFDHPVTLCMALIWAVSVFIWSGDFATADVYLDRFIAEADRHSLAPYQAVGRGVKGELSVRRGEAAAGLLLLREALEAVHAHRYELLTTTFNSAIAQGLAMTGQHDQAVETIDQTIALVERCGDMFLMPDLLRIKAEILKAPAAADLSLAERYLLQSLELAGRQSALSWELRAATSLAQLRFAQHRFDEALDVLAPVYDRFTEGFESFDLIAARQLLDTLAGPSSGARPPNVARKIAQPNKLAS
jgi:predicted ATPase/DNA-binding winged helix-turn-helix (wHTH) protein